MRGRQGGGVRGRQGEARGRQGEGGEGMERLEGGGGRKDGGDGWGEGVAEWREGMRGRLEEGEEKRGWKRQQLREAGNGRVTGGRDLEGQARGRFEGGGVAHTHTQTHTHTHTLHEPTDSQHVSVDRLHRIYARCASGPDHHVIQSPFPAT